MDKIAFTPSVANSLGIELELQLIDPATHDLATCADVLLAQVAGHPMADRIKPEITRSMIELNSTVHQDPLALQAEMREMRNVVCQAADAVGASVCGGGAHPFMRWSDQTISDERRFKYLAEMYGYLARQFTVFGQHIHVGVKSGDEAIALIRRLSAYAPHLIAMSASSPYCEGSDTLFACSRLNATNSFPLSGHMPADITDWYGFVAHMERLYSFGLAESIKDLYWDIRPQPNFGTVEVRICDTPLTVERACQIAAFVQALAVMVMREREPANSVCLPYRYNVFQASRFGMQGHYVTPSGERLRLLDHLRGTFGRLAPIAEELGTTEMVSALWADSLKHGNDARWMRHAYHQSRNLVSVVQAMVDRFGGRDAQSVEVEAALRPPERERRRIRASSEPLVNVQPFAALDELAMVRSKGRLH
jgi:carboxylate-amine ligase